MNKAAYFPKSMRRVLFVLVTVLLAGSVLADWMPLGRNGSFRAYQDPKSIQRNGDFAQIWQLMDFITVQWADAQTVVGSIRNLMEYDCTQPRFRTLLAEAYSEQMGGGRMVAKEQLSDPQWESVEPGSSSEKVRNIACRN